MIPARPALAPVPCPSCGQPVDPLRAPRVACLEDGVRYLCGDACLARFRDGEREFDITPRPVRRSSETVPQSGFFLADEVRQATVVHRSSEPHPPSPELPLWQRPLAGVVLAAAGLVSSLASSQTWVLVLGALCVFGSAAISGLAGLASVRVSRAVHWLAPAGVVLAALSALLWPASGSSWRFAGAALAALVVATRPWLYRGLLAPLRDEAEGRGQLLPRRARRLGREGGLEELSSEDLIVGDAVVVLAGEVAPADGVIEEGSASASRFPGAALERTFEEGDFLLAGTRIHEGALTMRILRPAHEGALSSAVGLAASQPQDQGPGSSLQWALASWGWVAVAFLASLILLLAGPSAAAASLLGIPLLGLLAAMDVPLEAGALAAAQRGMFFGGASALCQAGRVRTTAILRRGALTMGEPSVQQAHAIGRSELRKTLSLAAAAEAAALDHPIAKAIIAYADTHGDGPAHIRRAELRPGLGVVGITLEGKPLVVGRRQLLLDEGVSVALADSDASHIEAEGLSPIFVGLDGQLEAMLAIRDPLHPGAAEAVRRIADLPSEVVVLSGEERRTIERMAGLLGPCLVKAPLLPEERAEEIVALRETGGPVAAIGRGGTDDAALAGAQVPVSLQMVGSALEDRGVTLASQDIRDAAGALWIARAAARSVQRMTALGLGITLIVLVGAGLGWLSPAVAVLISSATEAWTLRAGSRLLRRVDLRVPTQR
jgi:cation transport ATPase